MTREDFFKMNDDEAINYIDVHYCIDDLNDACDDYVCQFAEDEEDFEELLDEFQPYDIVTNNLEGDELKEFLWETIIEQLEEIDPDEDGADAI